MKLLNESFAALSTATSRVIELYYPEEKRLFNDRLALDLLPFGWRISIRLLFLPGLRNVLLASRERRVPGVLGSLVCRTCYIDDVLHTSLKEGLEQVVILGAGFDSRAYRIAGIDRVQVFEVDLPEVRKLKRSRVEKVLGSIPEHVTLVGIDFNAQKLGDVLEAAGFQTMRKTLFIWEGVTQYITAEAVNDTLEFVSRASGAGSEIVFTYIRQGIIDGSDRSKMDQRIASFASRAGSPWIFGIDPAELKRYLAARGLALVEDVGAAEYRERYLAPLGREMNIFEGERAALARVTGPLAA
jgi:methyltransferase (TIGR00027 family)